MADSFLGSKYLSPTGSVSKVIIPKLDPRQIPIDLRTLSAFTYLDAHPIGDPDVMRTWLTDTLDTSEIFDQDSDDGESDSSKASTAEPPERYELRGARYVFPYKEDLEEVLQSIIKRAKGHLVRGLENPDDRILREVKQYLRKMDKVHSARFKILNPFKLSDDDIEDLMQDDEALDDDLEILGEEQWMAYREKHKERAERLELLRDRLDNFAIFCEDWGTYWGVVAKVILRRFDESKEFQFRRSPNIARIKEIRQKVQAQVEWSHQEQLKAEGMQGMTIPVVEPS
ncbi:hypothetical protein BJ508DRAFT_332570 [Ascobolus immersus RN42]|uniref:Uncharacterized protein n=1 Tax=Ascobolus immersus RN42 TaxID=1160509 RepID=A0A3N4HML9_ASCIM|nr:hypothetical protein BJ508DRAFT_332570 [Ascobolus immersus RN42]